LTDTPAELRDRRQKRFFWALDLMTAWTEASDGTDFAMSRAEQYVNEPDGDRRLREGLITLAGLLLLRVAQEAGSDTATPDELGQFCKTSRGVCRSNKR
jgi:hypothetical protein